MVYEWDEHQQTCYRLYIEEGKSLGEIKDHLKSVHDFAPSTRAFQTQFRRWNFPLKQRNIHKNDRVVRRVKELWEKNLAQREMLRILNEEEGFDITTRELMRVRVRNRWLLRMAKGDKPWGMDIQSGEEETQDPTTELTQDTLSPESQQGLSRDEAPVKLSKRQQRRKASGAAGQDGGIVRFPSETTLDNARIMLDLTMPTYRALRSHFTQICEAEGIIKKTDAGVVKWDAAKEKLIRQMPELQRAVWSVQEKIESRQVALEVICTDVTKRMRILEARMTLAQAKNLLGINPEQFREMRSAFYQVLGEAGLTRKSNATTQQWQNLKRDWGRKSPKLRQILPNMDQEQGRALEVLAKDILKRQRDGRRRNEPKPQQQQPDLEPEPQSQNQSPEPSSPPEIPPVTKRRNKVPRMSLRRSPRKNSVDMEETLTGSNFDTMSEVSHTSQIAFSPGNSTMGAQVPKSLQSQTSGASSGASSSQNGLPHPSRVLSSSSMVASMPLESQMGSSLLLGSNGQAPFMNQSLVQSQFTPAATPTPVYHRVQSVSTACAIFMRLHPSSSFLSGSHLWIATLTSDSVQELRQIAAEKFPGTMCIRIEGVLKDGKGGELPLPIEQDQELSAYIAHLHGAAPTFNVQLVWKTS
ncbi:hypothetical protein EsDP_00000330 [Epichloe bromicola]|uniref:Clr5 domain-containing protein n=1 Tax=Epichloe bromicola TaxID=79588 RepID=A0ABQ0CEK3_9HYPO